ncbi:MAG: rhomboid family intramembrane serine protease [Planctomycetes bacterium]|nr:rhomboid family intramembrane serine protease [Planctomycetota bacterium]
MIPIRDTIPSRRVPLVTIALVAANVAVFIYELSIEPYAIEGFFLRHGVVPARFDGWEWSNLFDYSPGYYWPLLSSMFLHGGWAHVIGNMWTLWIFGDNVEDRMGRSRFLVFYLLMGLAAAITHCFAAAGSPVPTVGASGAVAGVLGAYFVLFPHSRVITIIPVFLMPMFVELPAVTYLLIWFVMQLFAGTLAGLTSSAVGGVAWWAHIGGFVAGAALFRLFLARRSAH